MRNLTLLYFQEKIKSTKKATEIQLNLPNDRGIYNERIVIKNVN